MCLKYQDFIYPEISEYTLSPEIYKNIFLIQTKHLLANILNLFCRIEGDIKYVLFDMSLVF